MDSERDKFVSGSRIFMVFGVVEILFGMFLAALTAVLLVHIPYGNSWILHTVSLVEAVMVGAAGISSLLASRGRHAQASCWWYLIVHTAVGCATLIMLLLDMCLLFPGTLLDLVAAAEGEEKNPMVSGLYITIVTLHLLSFCAVLLTVAVGVANVWCLRRGVYHPPAHST
ncbi:uncharacterized protein LOC129595994 [Paramacrobiotus metropolitanus]|uniref:uncharacterized protein LOC129595994 n=1 Tax=Paramacrobiotus metropolitanus TaxID=2943436 RepID=UPI00244609F6|nr:uncharacterized protein LOC129595994 [Paramacrobiotus metropolitanus]